VRSAAQHRVDTTVAQLSEVGVQATGEVMDPDPFTAITDAVREFDIDEVIVSTHPETRSGWLRRDLVERVQQATGLPVAHVVVDLDAERQHLTHTLVVANRTLGGAPLVGLLKGKAAEKSHRFTVIVPLESGDAIEADLLLVAVGRGPVTAGLGYEEAGVTMDRGFVLANERLQTNVDGIYAVGDIVPGLQLAHRGFAQGIFVAEQIAGLNPPVIDEMGIPRVTYCDPEIASIGYTEAQAKAKFGEIETYDYSLGGNGKSQILQTQGFVKLVRQKDGPVVGVHMIGARMGEQVGEAQLIYNWEALPSDVAQLIHAHPTQNEALGEAHLALAGKPLHAHG